MSELLTGKQGRRTLKNLFARDSDTESDGNESSNSISDDTDCVSNKEGTNKDLELVSSAREMGGIYGIRIIQHREKGIAHQLWPASLFLCDYFKENQDALSFSGVNILELGAGVGLCGLFMSCHMGSPEVIVTDLEEALPTLNENIAININDKERNNNIPHRQRGELGEQDISLGFTKEVYGVGGNERWGKGARDSCITGQRVKAMLLRWGSSDDVDEVMHAFQTTQSPPTFAPAIGSVALASELKTTQGHRDAEAAVKATISVPHSTSAGMTAAALVPRPSSVPLVIASDCVYWEHLYQPFYLTIHRLVYVYGCQVIVAHVRRWKKDAKFFKMCRRTMDVQIIKETVDAVTDTDYYFNSVTRRVRRIYKIQALVQSGDTTQKGVRAA